MTFELPPLPYDLAALEPHISRKTMQFHYEKYHGGYVSKLNDLIDGTDYTKMPLEEIIRRSAGKPGQQAVFNNAAQAWNHTFFWNNMTPKLGNMPKGALATCLQDAFGSYDEFREQFTQSALNQFGSGWTWLVLDKDDLAIISTPNAENPLVDGKIPLLTCDVWEHAYYLDYQNQRKTFVETFLAHLINWDSVAARLQKAPQLETV